MRFHITPVIKVLLIMNIAVFLLDSMIPAINVNGIMSLYYLESKYFLPFQFLTYMFAHVDFSHIFWNMIGLIIFGPMLEDYWGPKRFLLFYLFTGFGGGLLQSVIVFWDISILKDAVNAYLSNPSEPDFYSFIYDHVPSLADGFTPFLEKFEKDPGNPTYISSSVSFVRAIFEEYVNNSSLLGASGAVLGVTIAFALLFPNTEIFLLFFPFPIKAKYLALFKVATDIWGIVRSGQGDSVAHFAHLGGMIFAVIIVQYWKTRRDTFY